MKKENQKVLIYNNYTKHRYQINFYSLTSKASPFFFHFLFALNEFIQIEFKNCFNTPIIILIHKQKCIVIVSNNS